MWSSIGHYLNVGDVARLLVASPLLSDRLKNGIRTLELEWCSSRYIELDTVLNYIASFKNLDSAEFKTKERWIRPWLPTQWSVLPRTLTSLSLSFMASPALLLARDHYLASVLPQLAHLSLEDGYLDHSKQFEKQWHFLDLLGLPSSLLSLRIQNAQVLRVDLEGIPHLPPCLEVLELDFPLSFGDYDEVLSTTATPLTGLPSMLKRLSLMSGPSHLLLRAVDLPTSLESLTFITSHSTIRFMSDSCDDVPPSSVIDFASNIGHLTNLKTISFSDIPLPPELALKIIPPSVTKLDIQLDPSPESDECLPEFLSKMVPLMLSYSTGDWYALEPFMLSQRAFATSLKTLVGSRAFIPPTAEVVYTNADTEVFIPNSVKTLVLHASAMPHTPYSKRPMPLTLPAKLTPSCHIRVLSLPYNMIIRKKDWFYVLPDTLEEVIGAFTNTTWSSLLEFMSSSPRLPRLRKIYSHTRIEIYDAFKVIPPQVTKMTVGFNIMAEDAEVDGLTTLKNSNITKLDITIKKKEDNPKFEALMIDLLNHLPQKLKTLRCARHLIPELQWPVSLPPNLTSLSINCDRVVPRDDGTAPADVPVDQQKLFFPHSLGFLSVPRSMNILAKHLPPYLSIIHGLPPGSGEFTRYSTSRQPPSPHLSLLPLEEKEP